MRKPFSMLSPTLAEPGEREKLSRSSSVIPKGFKGVAYLTWPRCSITNETSFLSNLMLPVDYWDRAQEMVLWITYLSHKFVVHCSVPLDYVYCHK